MKNSGRAATAALGALVLIPVPASAASAGPPPKSVVVELATQEGSGCRWGTVAVTNDADSFNVTYSTYMAQVGGGSAPRDAQKSCRLGLKITHPPEFTYALQSADHRGFASLEPGSSGSLRSFTVPPGFPEGRGLLHKLKGAYYDTWSFHESSDIEAPFKRCDANGLFTLKTELQVDLGASDPSKVSFVDLGSVDGGTRTTYNLIWKQCP
ncbi:DUF4360 domain-containing protein [Actinomadura rubrisoli]|uniref:DUF4360 domain-containing protein n=1 Tax=Actinomadura rubrisoli TaxID=2530368 RepID=A0A4R5AW11_9ACTN|nr:DUF4360 domain-containing protein [Actinomadura rubrisoli]TDD76159.1 DUF4360 domain-containing protein [Actinomadura rubrisoli]